MRIIRFALVLALLTLPALALAQNTTDQAKPAAKPAAPADQTAENSGAVKSGSIDFGVIGSSVTGDDARFNRYRDLGNGAFIDNFRSRIEKSGWFVDLAADHVTRQDARYMGSVAKPGTLKGQFMWDETRELVSDSTKSLFTQVTPGVFRVDDNVQNAMQAALTTTPNSLSTVLPAMLANYNLPFTLGTRRHVASGTLSYFVDKDTTVNFDVSHTNRTGAILYSGDFGFSNAMDIPQPIDQHTTNASLTLERQKGDVLLRAGFNGSYFRNDIPVITWDNPYRFTDVATLSAQGRTSVAPSNNFNVLNGSISVKMAHRSRLTGYVAFGFLDDNGATVVPYTINSALAVLPLPRNTVGGEGRTKNANLTFVSRPNKTVNFDVRYKYYDFENRTPAWTNVSRVQYDSSFQVGTLTAPITAPNAERFGGARSTLSADMHIVAPGGGSIGLGYERNQATYEERFFTGSHENVMHVSFDALSTQYVSLHTKYEHGVRRGENLDTTDMASGGEQPSMRHYDIADRDRNLFSLVATVFPVNGVSISATAGTGEDKYPTTNFGLTNAKHNVYSVGFDVDPNEHVNLNASVTIDDFKSTQWSRTANPAPDAQYTNPARDWSDDAHDRTEAMTAGLGFLNLGDKVNVRFSYDYNRGRGFYIYGTTSAPLDPVVATVLTAPVQLPNLVSDLTRGTFDITYAFTKKVAVGFTYWYEQFKVSDLALDSTALPAFNLATTDILMGYQYQPYASNTVFLRLTTHF